MKKKRVLIIGIVCFVSSVAFCLYTGAGTDDAIKEDTPSGVSRLVSSKKITPLDVGKFCVSQVYPGIDWDADTEVKTSDSKEKKPAANTEKEEKAKVDNSKPQVLIYHTHSSESYQPYTESNFHREEETGTVREVGDVLAAELNAKGISVVHDKTVHDRPSYNQSYDRSLSTITALQRQYPTAEVVIDLHRDAAAYTGNVGETLTINGETVAKYKLVIGKNNDNYSQLMAFAQSVNNSAEALYPGFSGRIIEKEYRYNEYIADKYLLLEVGNNQNDIEHAKATGKYFAHVLAAVLDEGE